MTASKPGSRPDPSAARREETALAVVLFEDMERSTAIKRAITKRADEHSYQELRKEHDATLADIITRDGAGQIVKWTGDGVIALFQAPSVAVERAVEIQDRLHAHPQIKARIGIDLGEVRLEFEDDRPADVFGAHVDSAARVMAMADGGHICVTTPVYRDAFNWITKSRIAWKRHGWYRAKPGEAPYEVYQPYNANRQRAMRKLRGEKVDDPAAKKPAKTPAPASVPADNGTREHGLEIIRPWEAVARDGRDFAQKGAGTMYWFKVPLGGLSYPDGFRHFLQPALENEHISRIRFILDSTNAVVMDIWNRLVLQFVHRWALDQGYRIGDETEPDRGTIRVTEGSGRESQLSWVFVDLSTEFSPCFKLFVDDPDSEVATEQTAQIFLSTAARVVRLADGTQHTIRIPDAVLRVRAGGDDALLHALNAVANQWDSLFW